MIIIPEAVRRAARTLARRRRLTIGATATFAVGIAGFTIMYSVVAGALLRPLRVPNADRVVAAYLVIPELRLRAGMERRWDSFGFSYQALDLLRARGTAFEAVGAMASAARVLTVGISDERIDVVRATTGMFDVLGARTAIGRPFAAGEDRVPGARVAVVSHDWWQARLGGRPDVIGQRLVLDDVPHVIVGVLAKGFRPPRGTAPDVWIPIGADPEDALPGHTHLTVVGRLRPGATAATAAMQTAQVVREAFDDAKLNARVVDWQQELTKSVRRPLLFLLVGATALLVMTCVSAAGLFVADLHARRPELATRAALGATLGRLVGQLVLEATLASVLASALGIGLAALGLPGLRLIAADTMPVVELGRFDVFVVATTTIAVVIAAVLIAIVTGLATLGRSPAERVIGRADDRHPLRRRIMGLAITGTQFALASLLLIGASLLAVNLRRMTRVNPGFDASNLMVLTVDAGEAARAPATAIPLFTEMANRIGALPHVRRAAVGSAIPFSGGNSSGATVVEHDGVADTIEARFSHVMPGFLETLGLRLLAGRRIDDGDREDAPLVAVVNETMAQRYWPARSPIGEFVRVGDSRFAIVGVVSDVRHGSVIDSVRPTVYRAERQRHSRYLQLLVLTDCNGSSDCMTRVASNVRAVVGTNPVRVVVSRLDFLARLVQGSFADHRLRALMTIVFAGLASILTIVAVLDAALRAVRERRREIAIRVALGSSSHGAVRHIARDLGIAVGVGAGAGMWAAFVASPVVRPFLTLVSDRDPTTYAFVTMVVGVVAIGAVLVAARSAATLDPAVVLKER